MILVSPVFTTVQQYWCHQCSPQYNNTGVTSVHHSTTILVSPVFTTVQLASIAKSSTLESKVGATQALEHHFTYYNAHKEHPLMFI